MRESMTFDPMGNLTLSAELGAFCDAQIALIDGDDEEEAAA